MQYNKNDFGVELKSKVVKHHSIQEIANWAYKIYSDPNIEYEDNLDPILLKLIAMEEGEEFVLTENELIIIAEDLINEKI